jgi:vacuolar-type H+-ATPase subunit I/STV1
MKEFWCGFAIAGIFSIPIWFIIGSEWRGHMADQNAVDVGAAEWRVDQKTGDVKFAWLKRD